MSELRTMIREILAEELGKSREQPIRARAREEVVSIRNNSELASFVRRILEIAQDGRLTADIASGRHVFKLTTEVLSPFQTHQPVADSSHPSNQVVFFETGLVTEKDVARLPRGLASVRIGKTVSFTPLARDELRRKGVKIERRSS